MSNYHTGAVLKALFSDRPGVLSSCEVVTYLNNDYTEFVCEKRSWEDITQLPSYFNPQYI